MFFNNNGFKNLMLLTKLSVLTHLVTGLLLAYSHDLQLQYSPSKWVKRVSPEKAVQRHIDIITKASAEACKKVPHNLNIKYGKREGQYFDLYGTDLAAGSPMFVFIHGGYWQDLSKDISAYPVIPLWQAGIICAVAGYDLAPKVTLGTIVEEIRELTTFILKMAKEDNCKTVFFGGHSAGAHLAASLLDADWLNSIEFELKQPMKGVVLVSGIYDVTPLLHTSENEALHLTQETAVAGSPLFKLETTQELSQMTALLAVAEHDSPAFHNQTKEYNEVLKRKNIPTTMKEILGEDHFSIVENLENPCYELTQTIIALMKL